MIEDEIKKEFDNYEIKTTSKMILDRSKSKKKLSIRNPFVWLIPSLGTLAFAVALVVVLEVGISSLHFGRTSIYDKVAHEKTDLLSSDIKSQLSLEILYAGALNDNNNKNQTLSSDITEDEYNIIVNNIEDIYPLFDKIDDKALDFTLKYQRVEFQYAGTNYKYKYLIADYIFYSINEIIAEVDDDEVEFEEKVLFKFDEEYYQGKIEVETEEDESELKITYENGNDKISIERESEEDEIDYKYTLSTNNKKIYEKKISIENDENLEFKYQYKNGDLEEELKIEEKNGSLKIKYQYKNDYLEYEADGIILNITSNGREYDYKNFKIIK